MWDEILMCVVFLIAIDLSSQSGQGSGSGILPDPYNYPAYFGNAMSSGQELYIHSQQKPNHGYPQHQSDPGYPQHPPNPDYLQQLNPDLNSQLRKDNGNGIPQGHPAIALFSQNHMTSGHESSVHPQQLSTHEEVQEIPSTKKAENIKRGNRKRVRVSAHDRGAPLKVKKSSQSNPNEYPPNLQAILNGDRVPTREEVIVIRKIQKAQYDRARNAERSRKFEEDMAARSNDVKDGVEAKRLQSQTYETNRLEMVKKFTENPAQLQASSKMQNQGGQFNHPSRASSSSEQDYSQLIPNLHANRFDIHGTSIFQP